MYTVIITVLFLALCAKSNVGDDFILHWENMILSYVNMWQVIKTCIKKILFKKPKQHLYDASHFAFFAAWSSN